MSLPGKFDTTDAGAVADIVGNVFIIWRNQTEGREAKGEPTCIVAYETT